MANNTYPAAAQGETTTPAPNTDDNAGRLTPNDDWAVNEAMRTGDTSKLTPKQLAMYRERKQQEAQADYDNYKTNVAPVGQTTTTAPPGTTPPTITNGNDLAAWTAWAQANGTSIQALQAGGVAPEPRVLRRVGPGLAPISDYGAGSNRMSRTAPLSAYTGEYSEKIKGQTFRDWMTKMAVVLGGMDPENKGALLGAGQNVWEMAGKMVAANPALARAMTPEEWLQQQYDLAGGDALYNKATEKANPITTTREVSTITITSAEAQAFVDDISQRLLGRMASDAELKRARGAMQKLLTPTVATKTTDATDPEHVQITTHTKQGVSPQDASGILNMRMQRSSEGSAFRAGKMFEEALSKMAL